MGYTKPETVRKWRLKNAKKIAAYTRQYRLRNRVEILAREKAYRKRHRVRACRVTKQYRDARRNFIAEAKNRPCTDCGQSYPHYVMDLDHVRGKKVKGLGDMWSTTLSAIKAEIAKCEVVCANCHRERHLGIARAKKAGSVAVEGWTGPRYKK